MLNATGCTELSGSGLRAMVKGLNFVELATSFYGFKPVEEVGCQGRELIGCLCAVRCIL